MNVKPCIFLFVIALMGMSACGPLGGPYGGNQGRYDDPYYDDYGYHRERDRDNYHRERDRVREERERLEEERRRLERERERDRGHDHHRRPEPERCPSGFSPSSKKCTDKQRKHGCQDIKTPGGLRCIRSSYQ